MKNPVRFLLYVPVPWVFVLIYLLGVFLEHHVPESLRPTALTPNAAMWSTYAGAAFFAVGLVIAGWGWGIFRKACTTTVPGKSSAALVTWGPYRFTRNPMYVGLTCCYLGEAGLLRQLWPVLVLPLMIAYLNWTVIPVEEARLTQVFPEDYEQYRSRVRRWI